MTKLKSKTNEQQLQGHENNTVESIIEEYGFVYEEHRGRLEEGFKLKKMFLEIDKEVKEGSQWYLLPKGWLKKWESDQ